MADTTTADLLNTIMGNGGDSNTWGDNANNNFQRLEDKIVKRTALATVGGTTTLSSTQELVLLLDLSGVLASAATIVFSGRKGFWIVNNGTTGSFAVTCKVSGQTGVTVAQGSAAVVYCNGTDIFNAASALADPGSNGLVARTASGTTVARTLTAPAAGITVTNGDGVSGNPTLVLANDLAALEALATTGLVARTAAETYVPRTITATAPVLVTNGDGVAAAPAFSADVATAAQFRANTATKLLQTDNVWSAADYVALTDAATVAVDMSLGLNFSLAIGGARTLGAPSSTKNGQSGIIVITQDVSGSRTLAYNAVWKFAGGTAPVLTTTASARDILVYQVISSSVIYASLVKDVK